MLSIARVDGERLDEPRAPEVRPVRPADLPAVARLFQKTFRNRNASPPASLASYLGDLFIDPPGRQPGLASLVYVTPDGGIGGFIGVLPLTLSHGGRRLRAAVAGSLMVDRPASNPLAGARLLRSFLAGPQDLSISETANEVSRRMWERLGGQAVPSYSMEWVRILRPAGFAVASLEPTFAPARALAPLAGLADRLAGRHKANPLRLAPCAGRDREAGDDELVRLIGEFACGYALRPDWPPECVAWRLAHAASKARYGQVFRRIVEAPTGDPVGLYIYYGRPRRVAYVLQVVARREWTETVIDCLLAHTWERGSAAVRGRLQPELMDALLRRRALMFHRSSLVVHGRDGAALSAIAAGDALITGLAGESWTRIIGDEFA